MRMHSPIVAGMILKKNSTQPTVSENTCWINPLSIHVSVLPSHSGSLLIERLPREPQCNIVFGKFDVSYGMLGCRTLIL